MGMISQIPDPTWVRHPMPRDIARRTAASIARQHRNYVRATGLTMQELTEELFEEIWLAYECKRLPRRKKCFNAPRRLTLRVDASRNFETSFQQWAWRIARAAMIDRARAHGTRAVAENAAHNDIAVEKERNSLENMADSDCPLSLPNIPLRLHRGTGRRAGRLGESPAAYAAALVLRSDSGWSFRRLEAELRNPAVARRCGFRRTPSKSAIARARLRLERWAREHMLRN